MERLRSWWAQINSHLWLLPALLTLAAAGLAILTVRLDQHGFGSSEGDWFILAIGAEGARGVLATIAGSIITVAGVVFSITIVVLQLASSQFSPRALRSFKKDRSNQIVLGVLVGTFTYALLVLRTVRADFDDNSRFVPALSVNIAVLLALISMGALIYFLSHVARSIQAETIIARITADALEVVDRLCPEHLGEGADDDLPGEFGGWDARAVIHAEQSGFLQGVASDRIMQLAEQLDLVLRLEQQIGSFVVEGDALISVLSGAASDVTMDALRKTATFGSERVSFQDVELGLIELTDVAVRALSPGINDPTTAVVCVQRLTEIFTQLGVRRFPSVLRKATDGKVRVIAPRVEFAEMLTRAYGQIRAYGQSDALVAAAIEESLQRVHARVAPERRPAVAMELERTRSARRETHR